MFLVARWYWCSYKTDTMTATPDKLTVSSWLAELRMECYKKHLEDYETIKVRYFIALLAYL